MRRYFHSLLERYLSVLVRPGDSVLRIDPLGGPQAAGTDTDNDAGPLAVDYVVLNGGLHYERDAQSALAALRARMQERTRLVIVYYSALWRPLTALATGLGLRTKTAELNWLAHSDIANLLLLADFEPVRLEHKVLLPVYVPLVSNFVNRYLAPLPGLSSLCMVNVLVARPAPRARAAAAPSVTIVVPARNEAGNIAAIVARVPPMGPDDEIVFVEGGSRDDTWDRINQVVAHPPPNRRIVAVRQDGKGKGDAVRKGFGLARNDILMILDADLTVPPEDLPKFYNAIVSGKGEFINGSRLVYPMEKRAMRFFNLVGNKFFALAFSYVLGQRLKDTLCGTKVITRRDYQALARHRAYFGDFDPFGDFDLIFGAARMGLKVVELPIAYRERTYGETNISRWRHGTILLAMLVFAARRLKFV